MSGAWWRGETAPAISVAVLVHVLGVVQLPPNSWKTRSSPNFPCCPLPSWELPMAINCQTSPELSCLRQKRLTPHLTQIAAWTGASQLLTHSNAITASWSSAQGAWGCWQSPGTKRRPSTPFGEPARVQNLQGGVWTAGRLGPRRWEFKIARDPGTWRRDTGATAALATRR